MSSSGAVASGESGADVTLSASLSTGADATEARNPCVVNDDQYGSPGILP